LLHMAKTNKESSELVATYGPELDDSNRLVSTAVQTIKLGSEPDSVELGGACNATRAEIELKKEELAAANRRIYELEIEQKRRGEVGMMRELVLKLLK